MIHSTSQLRGRTSDGVVHGGECLSGEAAALPEGVPELAAVATVQEVDVGLADGDVGRRRVGVQLLVPLLQEVVLDALCRLTHASATDDGAVQAPYAAACRHASDLRSCHGKKSVLGTLFLLLLRLNEDCLVNASAVVQCQSSWNKENALPHAYRPSYTDKGT